MNRRATLDVIERVGWTAVEAGIAVGIDQGSTGTISWRAIFYAAALAAGKCILALNFFKKDSASTVPGV